MTHNPWRMTIRISVSVSVSVRRTAPWMRRLKSCRNTQIHWSNIFTSFLSASSSLYNALGLPLFLNQSALFSKTSFARKKSVQVKNNRGPSSLCNVRGSSRQEAHGTKYEKGVILFRVRAKVWVLFVCPYVDKTRQVATKTFSMWFKSTLAWDLVGSMLWDHVAQHWHH